MDQQFKFWQRQTEGKPLFPSLQWSRPENRQLAGKLLVVGGNAFGFVAPSQAFAQAEKAGIGVVRMLVPQSVQRYVPAVFDAGDFAPATPSGSFSRQALAQFLEHAAWADAVVLAGDFGRNSETAILLESFAHKYTGPLTLAQDAIDYFIPHPAAVLQRSQTLIAPNFAQLQKLAIASHAAQAFTSQLDLLHFAKALAQFSKDSQAYITIQHQDHQFVAVHGQLSSTPLPKTSQLNIIAAAAQATVWWLQNPSQPFEALTTAAL
jgi:hypothetical protein